MATDRFAAWLIETKDTMHRAAVYDSTRNQPFDHVLQYVLLTKAVVFALLTIAVAINQAAEKKGK